MAAPIVLFMRAVNVGGHQTFKPTQFARDLSAYEAVNIGAAGTFVFRKPPSPGLLTKAVRGRLPFDTGLMFCPAREILALAGDVAELEVPAGTRLMLTVLAQRPAAIPALPLSKPPGDRWELQVARLTGRYAWTLYRPLGSRPLNVNTLVEKAFGVAGTTRNANTLAALQKVLRSSSAKAARE